MTRRRQRACALLAALGAAACRAPMVIDSPHVGGPASAVELPADAQRGGPCVVGTAERCFDATDDNCNGLIDEGCGLNAGEVQLMVAWEGEARVEVDVLELVLVEVVVVELVDVVVVVLTPGHVQS